MINLIIIDDEERARNLLTHFILNDMDDVNIVASVSNITDAYREIQEKKPNLILLDIQLAGGNGFDLLQMFDEIDFGIIFTTAYQEYAIRAIRFAAFDYLLKPIDSDALKETTSVAETIWCALQAPPPLPSAALRLPPSPARGEGLESSPNV